MEPIAKRFLPPSVFLTALKANVMGQDEVKPKLAHAFSHYTAFLDSPEVGKPLPLIYGPSGAGKTFSIELCASISGLDLTTIGGGGVSAAGYKGTTLRDLVTQHFVRYSSDQGVIFVDEIDKWCKGYLAQHEKPDPEVVATNLSKQSESLRYVEKEVIDFIDEGKDIEAISGESFDTSKTFWIFAGAFTGLDNTIKSRTGQEQISGDDIWEHAEPLDFVKYGMVEEFANRISVWAWVRPLTASQIMDILRYQDVPKWEALFTMIGCKLDLDPSALAAAANTAFQNKRGPRGAKMYLNRVLGDVYSESDQRHLTSVRVDGHTMMAGRLELHAV